MNVYNYNARVLGTTITYNGTVFANSYSEAYIDAAHEVSMSILDDLGDNDGAGYDFELNVKPD